METNLEIQEINTNQQSDESKKSRLTVGLLQLFLSFFGFMGFGRLYIGHYKLGAVQLILSIVFFCTGMQALTFFIALIDCIYVLCKSSLKDGKGKTVPFFSNKSEKSRLLAGLLQSIIGFFGLTGLGRLYLGKFNSGVIQIVISIILFFTGLQLITFLIGFFDFIFLMCNRNLKDGNGKEVPFLFNSSNSEPTQQISYKQHETINNTQTVAPVEIVPTVTSNIIKVEQKDKEDTMEDRV